ncbi:efflux RND transporter permease subunit [Thalassolituus sp.]|uniref:efflux RND transporter permease subunit n=1 Tax=Thalassolituus sp. TaxID=2030822 RepID=UPI003519106D
MRAMIEAAINRHRTVIMLFTLLLITGSVTLMTIPKESSPDVTIPNVYVSVTHDGISPEDADSLLYEPLETQLQGLEGLKEMISTATFGHLSIQLEFYSNVNIDDALDDVRNKVNDAVGELPVDSKEPVVREINVALFPVMVVTLAGDVTENVLYFAADELKKRIESLPGVLEVNIQGKREQVAELIIDPAKMDNYGLSLTEVGNLLRNNSLLVATEDLNNEEGRFSVKIPGRIEDIEGLLRLPVKSVGDEVVLFQDVAVGRLAFKDPSTGARVNGERAVALEIKKRIGANIIETLDEVREITRAAEAALPQGVKIGVIQDESKQIRTMLNDLFNSVLVATLLVFIIILGSLGVRSSLLVGLAIPGAFLMGIMAINGMGDTLNMVVLFALILSVGMLVDSAIVVVEYADRRLAEGACPRDAYKEGASRMAWPIIASTATTLAVFLPLLFWPGVMGGFMKYLPLTLLFTLTGSLIMALIVIPAVGKVAGRPGHHDQESLDKIFAAEKGEFDKLTGFSASYVKVLRKALENPGKTCVAVLAFVIASFGIYGVAGHGTEFFPDVDVDVAMVDIRARGNLSFAEREAIVRDVEYQIFDLAEIDAIYTSVFVRPPQGGMESSPPDLIGRIQLELIDWASRRTADEILRDIEQRTAHMPGIVIETRKKEGGPAGGPPIQLQLSGRSEAELIPVVDEMLALLKADNELKDVRDDRPLDGVEWRLDIDREEAVRYGASVAEIGSLVRMITGGQIITQFQPDYSDEELDILLRYPASKRTIDLFTDVNIKTAKGLIPLSQFVTRTAIPKTGDIVRVDGKRRYLITANVTEGVNSNEKIAQLGEQLKKIDWQEKNVMPKFRGDFEQQEETGIFLMSAFSIAIFMMVTLLVTQFNSFYQAGLIMSAIVLSVAGVLMGLLIRGEPFGIVMSGVGVISLAGIVVNNNIVLIDTYNSMRSSGLSAFDAALRTGAIRLRPVLLTAVTTVVGLIPMVMQWNIDLLHREFSMGAPSSQWWTQLSTAIAGGLTFATVLTLILTPSLLVWRDRRKD